MHSLWALQLLSKKNGRELHLDTPSAPTHFPVSQVLMKGTSESQQKLGGGEGGGRERRVSPLLTSLQMGWSFYTAHHADLSLIHISEPTRLS